MHSDALHRLQRQESVADPLCCALRERTLMFLDEDRPNACADFLYDTIRRPLFGRYSDIETVFILNDTMEFPGTYAGNQTWREKAPCHNECKVELSKFEKSSKDGSEEIVLWINTWNHLIGECNNNTQMDIAYQHCCQVDSQGAKKDFVVRKGSRAEVDGRFHGVMTTVSTVMTPEREKALGQRLF